MSEINCGVKTRDLTDETKEARPIALKSGG